MIEGWELFRYVAAAILTMTAIDLGMAWLTRSSDEATNDRD